MITAVKSALVPVAVAVVLCTALGGLFVLTPDPVGWDYEHVITVDKPEKVEAAVSNVLHLLERRDFVPTGLEIRRTFGGSYIVRGYGVDRGHMLQWD